MQNALVFRYFAILDELKLGVVKLLDVSKMGQMSYSGTLPE